MITEPQRRALFALREALHLCEGAGVVIGNYSEHGLALGEVSLSEQYYFDSYVGVGDVENLLAEHPE